uniref:Uncharacterized protein n=1 Tax=Heterosigma akashiwo TaxID=2829 RepID=A0A6V1XHF6_HETAK|mmetsp:Transcript_27073/g.42725  ORF Transcript_27073/g.42725 Transcript_27073/m.42725 type:complete len:511 (+) Transcript_27073:168-1700(+)
MDRFSKFGLSFLLWASCGLWSCRASEDSSRLQMQIPASLEREGGYAHQQALFGKPSYGGSISLQLFYTNSALCEGADADPTKWKRNTDNKEAPFILMADRGDCTFVSKVRRAQHAGAAGVLIADNKCLCGDAACTSQEACEPLEPIMADDGSGADITIPAFLMKKVDADLVKGQILQGQLVVAEMSWALPNPDDRVEWDLWTTAIDDGAQTFKQDFEVVTSKLGPRAYFTPHYVVYDGNELRCTTASDKCGNLCTNQGRYCLPDPDNDRHKGISGADVVEENLRQLCIWRAYGGDAANQADIGVGTKWWRYVNGFQAACNTPEKFASAACKANVMKQAGVDSSKVDKCMADAGGLEGDVPNALLAAEISEKDRHSIVIVPSVYVNGVVERGAVLSTTVLSTVCAGYAPGTEPSICACASGVGREEMMACVAADGKKATGGGPTGVSVGGVISIILAIVAVMTAAGLFYWRRTQTQMRDQVRGILAEYMPLEDLGTDKAGTDTQIGQSGVV